ncbi:MAG: hypothetical protein FWF21_08055 [Micrococcales bacterium]|nr:hypothetical protein [Micrococcales bacterium]
MSYPNYPSQPDSGQPGYSPGYTPPTDPAQPAPAPPGYSPDTPSGYPPQTPGYTPAAEPAQPGYTPQAPGYPPEPPSPGYSPQAPGYAPPDQPGFPPPQPFSPDGGQQAYPPPGYSPAGPQPGYPQPSGSRPSTTGGKVMAILGLVCLLGGVVGLVVGIIFMAQPIGTLTSEGIGSGVVAEVPSAGTTTTELKANTTYEVWIVSNDSGGEYTGDLQVTSPGGRNMDVSKGTYASGSANGMTATFQWKFTTDGAGNYEIAAPALPSGAVVVATGLSSKISTGVVLLVVGIVGMVLGFLLTLIGVIVWISRKKKAAAFAPSYA